MNKWNPIATAPQDGSNILVLTTDEEVLQAYWDAETLDFYKSQEGWASYDPVNAKGTWVSRFVHGDDKRLFCGYTPKFWMPVPKTPSCPKCGDPLTRCWCE